MFLANHIDYLAGTRLGICFHQDICWVVTKSLPEVNRSHPSSNQWINEEHHQKLGLPWWLRGSRICLQCRRYSFDPWVRKVPWRRKRQPTPVFLPGESPWAEEPGRLQSTGSQRVGHGWATKHTWSYQSRYCSYSHLAGEKTDVMNSIIYINRVTEQRLKT